MSEQRAKYDADQLKKLGEKGHAFKNEDGTYSYPIDDAEDLTAAIHAVGRGNADHDKLRAYIIGRAKALDESDEIPGDWNDDGSLKSSDDSGDRARPMLEWRRRKAASLSGLERRTFPVGDMELREDANAGLLHLTGYASVTETPYDMGFYTETIQRGAFKRSLSENPDVQLLVNHKGLPLARTKSGTLQLTEDKRGLRVDADLDPEDPDVQSLARKMKRGDIDQMSFAFQATDDTWNDDWTERTIKSASIHRGDVSVVNQGANDATTASIRSAEAIEALQRMGAEAVIDALAEWRDHTLLPLEERAGKTLSSNTMEVLTKVLALVQRSDDAVDEAIPMLAELMGVPNPDADDPDNGGPPREADDTPSMSTATDGARSLAELNRQRENERLFSLRGAL